MEVWPALDLYNGRVVRLRQGRFDQVTDYGNPEEWLDRLEGLAPRGQVRRVHLVDLEGARHGQFSNWSALAGAVARGFEVQVGGGFRMEADVRRAVDAGARHVIMGTALLADQLYAAPWFSALAEHVTGSLDIRQDTAMIRGWENGAGPAAEVFETLCGAGLARLTVTDVGRDGTLLGMADSEAAAFWKRWAERAQQRGVALVAGGGIRDAEDLKRLRDWQVPAAVVGRAWLEGNLPPYPTL